MGGVNLGINLPLNKSYMNSTPKFGAAAQIVPYSSPESISLRKVSDKPVTQKSVIDLLRFSFAFPDKGKDLTDINQKPYDYSIAREQLQFAIHKNFIASGKDRDSQRAIADGGNLPHDNKRKLAFHRFFHHRRLGLSGELGVAIRGGEHPIKILSKAAIEQHKKAGKEIHYYDKPGEETVIDVVATGPEAKLSTSELKRRMQNQWYIPDNYRPSNDSGGSRRWHGIPNPFPAIWQRLKATGRNIDGDDTVDFLGGLIPDDWIP